MTSTSSGLPRPLPRHDRTSGSPLVSGLGRLPTPGRLVSPCLCQSSLALRSFQRRLGEAAMTADIHHLPRRSGGRSAVSRSDYRVRSDDGGEGVGTARRGSDPEAQCGDGSGHEADRAEHAVLRLRAEDGDADDRPRSLRDGEAVPLVQARGHLRSLTERPPELRAPDILDAWRLPGVLWGMAMITAGAWWLRASGWRGR